jgi:membrane protease YdiL (CAAX protease family)
VTAPAGVASHASVATGVRALAVSVALVLGLAVVVAARWAATRAGVDALAVGLVFGLALAVLAWLPRGRAFDEATAAAPVARPRVAARDLVVGAVAGAGLVALAGLGVAIAGAALVPGLGRPAAPFVPWATITIIVAAAEEALLRGRLFSSARAWAGIGPAVAVTTIAFALMHVPLYGWHVVPLDLGVGLVLAGLRLGTGGIMAPAVAHAVADLATWWL